MDCLHLEILVHFLKKGFTEKNFELHYEFAFFRLRCIYSALRTSQEYKVLHYFTMLFFLQEILIKFYEKS